VGKEARKAVAIFQNEARMNRIQLQLVISDTFSKVGLETVMTDPVRVGQVVTNLLSNATKFTASSVERRIELRIDIGFERPPNGSCTKPPAASEDVQVQEGMPVYIYVSVSDTGPGLTEAELEHLFERFTQASPMTHTVFGGSGLGLFVCRKIVLRMGGGIDVTSEYGKGSEFRFFIEAKVGTVAPPVAVKPTSSPTPGLGKPSTPNRKTPRGVAGMKAKGFSKSADQSNTLPSTKRRILVVEDNLINRTVLLRQLKHVGWVADSATNGLEGVKKIRTAMNLDVDREGDEPGAGAVDGAGYDCVLMDLEMPVMDGYTAVRNVREHESLGELRRSTIIALSELQQHPPVILSNPRSAGNARQAQLDDHMANFDEVVVKPYRLDDLLHKIEQVIRQVEQVPKNNGSGGGRVIPIGTNGRVGSPRPGTALSKSCGP
jgi:CheY-like chemotaxis protein